MKRPLSYETREERKDDLIVRNESINFITLRDRDAFFKLH